MGGDCSEKPERVFQFMRVEFESFEVRDEYMCGDIIDSLAILPSPRMQCVQQHAQRLDASSRKVRKQRVVSMSARKIALDGSAFIWS